LGHAGRSFRLERDDQGNEILRIETAPMATPKVAGGRIVGTVIWARSHEGDQALCVPITSSGLIG
jgi:small neutral amino acid transporter SnatA (MarC family)